MKKIIIIGLVTIVILLFIIIGFVGVFVLRTFQVKGSSMAETYKNGDYLLALSCEVFSFCKNIARQDIMIVTQNEGISVSTQLNVIGRIIALPGDKLMIKEAKVYINGSELVEPYVNGIATKLPTNSWMQDGVEYTVPTDNYFVLGDNRNNSRDSRFSDVKYITKENILYKVIGKY